MISARVGPPLRPSTRRWMFAIGLFAVLPILVFSLLAGRALFNQQRADLHSDLQRASDVAARELAQEVRIMFAALDALAVSEAAQRADYAALHTQASRVAILMPRIGSIAGINAEGVRQFTTLAPFAVILPPSSLTEFDMLVVRTGVRQISPLVSGSISGKKLISFAVPVKQGDKVIMVLRLSMWSQAIGELVHEQGWPAMWQAGVIDQNMIVIARASDEARYVGQPTTPGLQAAIRANTTGPFPLLGRGDEQLTATLAKVAGTSWHVVTAAPVSAVNAQLIDALAPTLWIGAVCVLLSVLGTWWLARSLRRQLRAVAEAADAQNASATDVDAKEIMTRF